MNKISRVLLIIGSCALVALLGLVFTRNLIDFPVYYAAGRSLVGGRTDLYSPDFALGRVMDYRYPPFFLFILFPVWLAPYSAAAYLWYLASVAEITGFVLLLIRVFPSLKAAKRLWLPCGLAVGQYLVMSIHYGNAHLLATFLLFASLYFVLQRRDLPAALLMALAITIKLTPVMLLPYFVIQRRWKFLASTCVLLVALNIVPSAYFGFRGNIDLLRSWYGHVVASQEFHEDNGPINLSLKGELRRHLSSVDYSQRVDGDINYPSVSLASFPRETLDGVWRVIAVAIFLGALVFLWRAQRTPRTSEDQAFLNKPDVADSSELMSHELGLMICLTLFAAPLTSKIYFIELLWPVAALASVAAQRFGREGKIATGVLVTIASINSVLPLLPGRSAQRLLLVLGVDFYVNCLMMAALAYLLMLMRPVLRSRAGAPQRPAR